MKPLGVVVPFNEVKDLSGRILFTLKCAPLQQLCFEPAKEGLLCLFPNRFSKILIDLMKVKKGESAWGTKQPLRHVRAEIVPHPFLSLRA